MSATLDLPLSRERLDGLDNPEIAAGLYPLADLERPLLRQVTQAA